MYLLYYLRAGGVAHRLEQAAHNHLVVGSIPTTPTNQNINNHHLRWLFYNGYVIEKIKKFFTPAKVKQLTDVRNIGMYVFVLVIIAITWSGVTTVQDNYELQKQISQIKQQNAVVALQNANKTLENQFLGTNQYLELAARQSLGLAAPGEKVIVVPRAVALRYAGATDTSDAQELSADTTVKIDDRPSFIKNMQDWRDFLLGRKLFSD